MPAGSLFTRLCEQFAALQQSGRADLHIHSNSSDGEFSPQEIVQHAIQNRISTIAVTDHDHVAAILPTQTAARNAPRSLEVIPGVEITCQYQGREVHLLGYYFRATDEKLLTFLAAIRQGRRQRFLEFGDHLQKRGIILPAEKQAELLATDIALGRRHIAQMLIEMGQARTMFTAFAHHLNHPELKAIERIQAPIADAIQVVHEAGGITSWAHPPEDLTLETVHELRALGLDALEAEYPWSRSSRGKMIRNLAQESGLAISGGSDCHGPQPQSRMIGCRGISREELSQLHQRVTK